MNDLWLQLWGWAYKKALAMLTQPDGGVGIIQDLGSGYSVEDERMEAAEKLRALCEEAVSNPAWVARGGTTYCNRGARFIAQGMGYFGFDDNDLANDMILKMAAEWREEIGVDNLERAAKHAQRGGLAFLCLQEYPHGHVAACYPAPMEDSGSWGEKVPALANIGKSNGIIKASQAFRAAERPALRVFLYGETA